MDNNNNTQAGSGQGNFFSGFLLGALVGAAVVFLLGTKKGKKLLEIISKDGIENISSILDETSKIENLREKASPLRPAQRDFEGQAEKEKTINAISVGLNSKEKIPVERARPKIRRFFRGVSRHLN